MATTGKKCIVTLAIGDYYIKMWQSLYSRSWKAYAAKHGYDIIVITEHLDTGPLARARSPHWQKCLILEHPDVKKYDHVVWMDADIIINYRKAPCVVDATNEGKVGAVSHQMINASTPKAHANRIARGHDYSLRFGGGDHYELGRPEEPVDYYRAYGIDTTINEFINAGVLVYKRTFPRELLKDVYRRGEERKFSMYENMLLSHELLSANLVDFIDTRFNADYLYEVMEAYPYLMLAEFQADTPENRRLRLLAASVIWNNNYFIHCVSGAAFSRLDVARILADADDWDMYKVR